ncbi:hypothetical protein Tco_0415874 [Tanacetum coccineum]
MDPMIPIGQRNTLVEYMILSGAENHQPMLDKDLTKKYAELSVTEKIQADCDMKAINIILQGLLTDIYSLVNHHRVAKDLWEKVQLLMQGTSLTKQDRECKLYDAFDKFVYIKGESIHQYYLRFTQLMNDMNIYKMKLEQFQVNTKFLNSLPPKWSKFVTDVTLVKDLHTTNFDQLHAYLEQHELHANESSYKNPQFQQQQQFSPSQSPQYGSTHPTQHYSTTYPSTPLAITYPSTTYPNSYSSTVHQEGCPQSQSVPQIEYIVSTVNQQTHLAKFPQIDSGLAVPVFKQGDNPIDAINKMMSFLEKVLLVKAQGNGKVLNEEELEFLADSAKAVLMANLSSYRSDVLSEVPISDNTNNDMLNLSVQEMPYYEPSHFVEHLENEIHTVQDTNSSAQQDALILYVFEQLSNQVTNYNKVNNDNLIANESLSAELERYKERVKLLEERQNVDLGTREKLIIDDIIREKNAQFADFEKEINNLKQTLSEQSKEKELLTKTFNVFKNESKEKEAKNIDTEIALEKKVKELDNIVCKMGQSAQTVHMLTKPQVFYDNNLKQALGFQNPFYLKKAQQIRPMLYDGNVIAKETNVISIADSEETLMLEEESRSKMLLKQSDPMVLEKKVNTKPIDYAELNRLSEDFGKRFVPQ